MRFSVSGSFDLVICSHHDSDADSAKVEGVFFAAGLVQDISRSAYRQLATLIRGHYGLSRKVSVYDRHIAVEWGITLDGFEVTSCESTFRTDGKLIDASAEFRIHISELVRNRLASRQRIAKDNFERAKEELESISIALLNLPDADSEEDK